MHQNVRGLTTQTTPGINYLAFVIAATIESYAESAIARISSSVRSCFKVECRLFSISIAFHRDISRCVCV